MPTNSKLPAKNPSVDKQIYADAPPAYLSRRLAAMVYELLIVTAIVIMVSIIASVIAGQFAVTELQVLPDDQQTLAALAGDEPLLRQSVETYTSQVVRGVVVVTAVVAAVAGWFIWCWIKTGQTLPMKVWNLRVQHADGRKISTVTACLRLFFACFSLALFGLGFLYSLIDAERRTLHDVICNTVMVRLPKAIRSV